MSEEENKKALADIKQAFYEIANPAEAITGAIGLMVAGAENLNKEFGLGRSRIIEMNTAFADSAAGVEKLGGKLSDVTTTISQIAEASHRNVIENEKVVSELYASAKILETTSGKLVSNFKDVGYETSQIAPNLSKSIEYIQSVGLNATQVMKDVSENMGKMNRYQFEGGVQGLAKMAAQASMLRFDMQQTFNLAEKVLDPEGAIEVAGAFQRLGVSVGDLADPFQLMNQSINDPSGLQKSLSEVAKQFTYFDEETKSFKINPPGVLTLRAMDKQTGVSAAEMSKMGLAAADLDKRLSQVSSAGLKFENEEDKQYLANIANMGKGGKYEVTLNDGTKKELQNLNQEEFDELIKQQRDAPKTVEDIQRSQLTALQSIAGDMKAVVDSGKFGVASTKDITTNMEGLRNIVTKFADAGQKAIPKTPEVREAVTTAMDSFKNLFDSKKSGEIGSDKFNNNLKALEDTFLNKGKSMSEDAYKAVQDILKETANNVKGNSAIEKFFRNTLLTTPTTGSTNKTTTTKGQTVKPLSRSAVMGVGTTAKNYAETTTSSKQVNGQMDFGGTITIKVDAPPGVSEQQFKTFFESDEFKRKIYEYYNQKAKELERR